MELLSCPNYLLKCRICIILLLVFGTCSTLKLTAPSPSIHGIEGQPLILPIHYDVNASASGVQIIWLLERPPAPPACLLTSLNHTFIPDLEFQHKFTMHPPNASLLINSLHMSDEGNYTVKVNIQGETTMSATQKIEVSVHIPVSEPIIESGPSYGAVEYVGNLTFKCHVMKGSRVRYQWLKNGSLLPNRSTYSFSRDRSSFTISPVMKKDIGNYSCVASNYISEMESDSITPIIYYGPYDLRVISDKGLKVGEVFTIANGESVRFDCSADSNPPNTCAWIQRGNNSTEIVNYGPYFKFLPERGGQKTVDYLCRAYNNITGKGEEAQFTVIITPIVSLLQKWSSDGNPKLSHNADPEKLIQTSSLFPLAAITGVSLFVIVSICFIFVWKKYQLHRAIQWKLQPRRPSTEYRRTPIYSGHEDAINDFGIYEFVSLPDSSAPHRVIAPGSNSLQVQDINGTIYEVIQFVPEQMQNDPQS